MCFLLFLPGCVVAVLLIRSRPDLLVHLGRLAGLLVISLVLVAAMTGWLILGYRSAAGSPRHYELSPNGYLWLHIVHRVASESLMFLGGGIVPFLLVAPFARQGASKLGSMLLASLGMLVGLLVVASAFTGYLVPAQIPFVEWAIEQKRIEGPDGGDGPILRFVILHVFLLPILMVSGSGLLVWRLRQTRLQPPSTDVGARG
jgi:hypothetical protein